MSSSSSAEVFVDVDEFVDPGSPTTVDSFLGTGSRAYTADDNQE